MYYNTTNETGEDLKKSISQTNKQQIMVLRAFKDSDNDVLTPCQVWYEIGQLTAPLTSIRRSVTDLTSMGFLVKTPIKRVGIYGKLVHCWKLSDCAEV